MEDRKSEKGTSETGTPDKLQKSQNQNTAGGKNETN
jgi:hypothetical protein